MASRPVRTLAWALGIAGILACTVTAGFALALGAPLSFLLVYLVGILMGLLGALVASRAPKNSIGWLMCANSLAATLVQLPAGYGYVALVIHHGAWPLGSAAAWFGAWSWVPVVVFLPLISVRFPDGKIRPRWRAVDWLAIAGVSLFALAIALGPAKMLIDFLPIPNVSLLSPYVHNPLGVSLPVRLLSQVQGIGLTLILLGYVAGATSLITRFRSARGDETLQLKWFAYAGALIAAAFVYGAVAWNFFGQPLYLALTPLEVAALTLPVAIGIAILRYRLYDIDVIINRSLVYGDMTAMLAAVYAASTTLFQRLFLSASGARSDASYVLAAFVVVVGFSPLRDWLQKQVDRRLGGRNPAQRLDQFRASVDAVVSVVDVERAACRLLDEAIAAFNARGGSLYLQLSNGAGPTYSRGAGDEVGIEVALHHEHQQLGRLVLGSRRDDVKYTERDRDLLQRSADAVGEALALATLLGHRPLPKPHR